MPSLTKLTLVLLLLLSPLALAQDQATDQDAMLARGQKLFNQCRSCHPLDAGGQADAAPNLYGIVGRKVGEQKDFTYSPALLSTHVTWNERELDRFLKDPAEFAAGTAMAYSGMKNPADRKALIAYLKAQVSGKEKSGKH